MICGSTPRLRLAVLLLGVGGCAGDDSGLAQPTGTASGPGATTTTTGSSSVTDPSAVVTDSVDASTTRDEETTTPTCEGEGCVCAQEDPCGDGLDCVGGICVAATCGDGMRTGAERCDDANVIDGDGCDADCTPTQIQIDVSFRGTCALIEGGRVRCWGDNAMGQAGVGNTEDIGDDEHPYEVGDVPLPSPLQQLQSGDRHVCGLIEGRQNVLCWGAGSGGVLGYGNEDNVGDDEFLNGLLPVNVGTSVSFITTGGSHTCVTTTAGQVKCWGRDGFGELGYGRAHEGNIGDDEVPAALGNVQIGAAIVALSAGIRQTCVITSTGAVKCWGYGGNGQLGYGNTADVGFDNTPASVEALGFETDALQISAGFDHTCAVFEGGSVRCWGASYNGQLGQGNTASQGDVEPATAGMPVPLPFEDAVAVSAGDFHSCALSSDGQMACWGDNTRGQLGIGSTDTIGDDEPASATSLIDFDAPIAQMDAGGSHTCAVLEDNRVYCWGDNGDGQLGLAHTDDVGDDELPADAGSVLVFAPSR